MKGNVITYTNVHLYENEPYLHRSIQNEIKKRKKKLNKKKIDKKAYKWNMNIISIKIVK